MLALLALGVRALMPSGYMTASSGQGITITLCSGETGKSIELALPGSAHDDERSSRTKSHADAPCAFAGLAHDGLAAVDPIQLAIAIALILALGIRPIRLRVLQSAHYLRPPLRGPPLTA